MSTPHRNTLVAWLLVGLAVAILIPIGCSVYVNEDYEYGAAGGAGGWIGGGGQSPFGCSEEVCDGFDNDCDGLVDEDCPCDPGEMQYCYSGNPVTVGIGQCEHGQQTCADSGFWGTCSGETRPAEELCDTFDNDCDGYIDEDCPCDPGQTQPCYDGNPITMGIGECVAGTQTCDADGAWEQTCVGAIGPDIEVCNGADDDCDGSTDLDDSPAELICPAVANGTPDCVNDVCVIAGCDTDYANANNQYADGCECLADPLTSVGADCANAIDVGTLSDIAQDLHNMAGNGGPAGRSLWYRFVGTDDLDTAGDEYHVDIRFMVNPATGYSMDVYRNGCSPSDQVAVGETESYDWFTDFSHRTTNCAPPPAPGPPCGEGNCVPANPQPGENTCDDDTATYYVRIFRVDGAASCDQFQVEMSNGVW